LQKDPLHHVNPFANAQKSRTAINHAILDERILIGLSDGRKMVVKEMLRRKTRGKIAPKLGDFERRKPDVTETE
jgi:hypothetical protein